MRPLVYGALALLFMLHTDVWLWNDGRFVFGLPVGLTYHLLWTAAVVVVLWLAVRYAWPEELEEELEAEAAETARGARLPEGGAMRRGGATPGGARPSEGDATRTEAGDAGVHDPGRQ